jgi:hypothetical protein
MISQLGLKQSPLENYQVKEGETIIEEEATENNIKLFFLMIDFLRDSAEIFFIIRRQREKKIFDENDCNTLLKLTTKARYNLGEMIENVRLFERNLGIKSVYYFLKK